MHTRNNLHSKTDLVNNSSCNSADIVNKSARATADIVNKSEHAQQLMLMTKAHSANYTKQSKAHAEQLTIITKAHAQQLTVQYLRHSLTQSGDLSNPLQILTVRVWVNLEICLKNLNLFFCKCCSHSFCLLFRMILRGFSTFWKKSNIAV
jgi:hypothetical protein